MMGGGEGGRGGRVQRTNAAFELLYQHNIKHISYSSCVSCLPSNFQSVFTQAII